MPWPPPTHIGSSPTCLSVCGSESINVEVISGAAH